MSSGSFKDLFKRVERDDDYWAELVRIEFTEELSRLMDEQNVSRTELAKRIGKSAPYVTKLLNGDGNFTIMTMARLARALGARIALHLAPREVTVNWVEEHRPQTVGTIAAFRTADVPQRPRVSYAQTMTNTEISQASWSH